MNQRLTSLTVHLGSDARTFDGATPVTVARDPACDLPISHPAVSRECHLMLRCDDGTWVAENRSSAGTFVDDEPIATISITGPTRLRLGANVDGPTLLLVPGAGATSPGAGSSRNADPTADPATSRHITSGTPRPAPRSTSSRRKQLATIGIVAVAALVGYLVVSVITGADAATRAELTAFMKRGWTSPAYFDARTFGRDGLGQSIQGVVDEQTLETAMVVMSGAGEVVANGAATTERMMARIGDAEWESVDRASWRAETDAASSLPEKDAEFRLIDSPNNAPVSFADLEFDRTVALEFDAADLGPPPSDVADGVPSLARESTGRWQRWWKDGGLVGEEWRYWVELGSEEAFPVVQAFRFIALDWPGMDDVSTAASRLGWDDIVEQLDGGPGQEAQATQEGEGASFTAPRGTAAVGPQLEVELISRVGPRPGAATQVLPGPGIGVPGSTGPRPPIPNLVYGGMDGIGSAGSAGAGGGTEATAAARGLKPLRGTPWTRTARSFTAVDEQAALMYALELLAAFAALGGAMAAAIAGDVPPPRSERAVPEGTDRPPVVPEPSPRPRTDDGTGNEEPAPCDPPPVPDDAELDTLVDEGIFWTGFPPFGTAPCVDGNALVRKLLDEGGVKGKTLNELLGERGVPKPTHSQYAPGMTADCFLKLSAWWDAVSAALARRATGRARVIRQDIPYESTFNRIELDILKRNPAVTAIEEWIVKVNCADPDPLASAKIVEIVRIR